MGNVFTNRYDAGADDVCASAVWVVCDDGACDAGATHTFRGDEAEVGADLDDERYKR
ncbi:MAG TPA: hypothetical protein H9778_08895 [Candidatus Parabacteroides intestinavium]|nr:hypothetical protein [Candidatus Parabacteroides intestinavium]